MMVFIILLLAWMPEPIDATRTWIGLGRMGAGRMLTIKEDDREALGA
ncbi:MAG: hypothetical protein ACWA5W_11380 [Phycisphaerales bacterium]